MANPHPNPAHLAHSRDKVLLLGQVVGQLQLLDQVVQLVVGQVGQVTMRKI
jgi:hypothetical protein